jgi:hypothetical protein
MFTAYFDASGTKRTSVLTVSGFVSRVEKWARFEQEWGSILKREGINFFHMTDFASSLGEFEGWKGQTERRRKLIQDFVACVKKNTNKGFSCSVVMDDYNAVNKQYLLDENFGMPYVLAGFSCIAYMGKWAAKRSINPKNIVVMLESGDEDQDDLKRRCRDLEHEAFDAPKSDFRAFQAGDLAGWKSKNCYKQHPLWKSSDSRRWRKHFEVS